MFRMSRLFIGTILLTTVSFVFVPAEQGICSAPIRLDEEAVFCLYFKLSGDPINDQDIEDLCYAMGKPTFSAYKPAEFVFKKTLTEKKDRLLGLMKAMDEKSEFEWRLSCQGASRKSGPGHLDPSFLESEFPAATSLIRAAVSKKGKKDLTKAFRELWGRATRLTRGGLLELDVRLVPERVGKAYQTRNIARENILLPIRYVFFRPVRIKMISPKGSLVEPLICNMAGN